MTHEDRPETILPVAWRLLALMGIIITLVAMLSSNRAHLETPGELRVPVLGVAAHELVDSFSDPRDRDRRHEAIDIPAPRGTPVVAVATGTVRRIFSSPRGGLGVYQVNAAATRCFYYAHLDGYAAGLEQGQLLGAGDPIGYVGTSGNAPDELPHLHFAVMTLTGSTRCADARAINPTALFR